MSRKSLSLVNQKLTHARLLLAQLERADGPLSLAIAEAVAGHMVCAYRHYLREVAENYQVRIPGAITSEAHLTAALETMDKYPSEARELVDLRARPSSWVSEMHSAYDFLWAPPVNSGVQRESAGLIPLVAVDDNASAVLTLDKLSSWYEEFLAMIQRHRETSAEW